MTDATMPDETMRITAMRIAGHTMGTPEHTLPEAIDLFASIGLEGVEIIWDDEYKCALRKGASAGELAELGRRLRDHGLKPSCLTPYMTGIDSVDPKTRRSDVEDFRRCIDAAGVLGATCIRVYGGAYQPAVDRERRAQLEEVLVESLITLGAAAAQTGVVLAVETHFNTLTCGAAETAALVRRVGHPSVQVLYDQPNLEFSDGEAFPEALRLLEGLIAMVHVKDLVYKKDVTGAFSSSRVVTVDESERRVSSRIPGQGIVPWPAILPALAAQGFEGWLSLEYERRWYPYDLPPAREGMKQGFEYIKALLARMEPADRGPTR
jgi:L-ribulose-5-phosphate 3-epimerase